MRLALLARETRRFDVIFLDPPFARGSWESLLHGCRSSGSRRRISCMPKPARALVAPPGLEVCAASDKAGQVHYHLLRRADGNRRRPGK